MGLHTIILDAGPLLSNDPSISTLVAKCEKIYTTPAVLSELRDKDARARVQTSVLPFLTIKCPSPTSIKIVTDFARRTGDLTVLSRTDVGILALAYELECERNQGDWRLRRVPGQKGLNGAPPTNTQQEKARNDLNEAASESTPQTISESQASSALASTERDPSKDALEDESHDTLNKADSHHVSSIVDTLSGETEYSGLSEGLDAVPEPAKGLLEHEKNPAIIEATTSKTSTLTLIDHESSESAISGLENGSMERPNASRLMNPNVEDVSVLVQSTEMPQTRDTTLSQDQESSDSEDWITPANLKKHQAKDQSASATPIPEEKTMQVSTITSDFAMQNVLLQMNLNLLSSSLLRIKHLKTFILRCHACFQTTKQMDKQFCPRCGKPTLTRVSCSTNAKGEFQIHLKKNMQWNTRGDRYSIPKPISGTSNGKFGNVKGGGKGGWGQELILAEDQKEHMRAMQVEGRRKERNLMDEDYLPSILTGDRGKVGGRPKIGAGRNVNSKKRG